MHKTDQGVDPMRLAEFLAGIRRIVIVAAGGLALAACSTAQPQPYNQYLASWKGKTEQELVIAFGIPGSTHVMAGGGRVLEYQERDGDRAVCTTRFTVNAGGRVDGWWYKGTECTPPPAA